MKAKEGAEARAWCARQFWETLHIDLRMVDTSDFTISYCPTNIYSVGTPHEIIMATLSTNPCCLSVRRSCFPPCTNCGNTLERSRRSSLLQRLELGDSDQGKSARHSQSLVFPAGGRRKLLRWFWLRTYGNVSAGPRTLRWIGHEKRFPPKPSVVAIRRKTEPYCLKSGIENSISSWQTTIGSFGIFTSQNPRQTRPNCAEIRRLQIEYRICNGFKS